MTYTRFCIVLMAKSWIELDKWKNIACARWTFLLSYRTLTTECTVIMCSFYYFLDIILFHHDFHHYNCDCHWDFEGHSLLFELHFRLSVTN